MYFYKREKILAYFLCLVHKHFSPAVQNLDHSDRGRYEMSQIIPKMHDYLQKSQIPLCAINNTNIDSELRKRFFRKFRNFSAPGLQVRKSRISWDKTDFWKIVVILTIFGKFTIFQSPLKCVDEGWHRRWKKSEFIYNFIIDPQNIM